MEAKSMMEIGLEKGYLVNKKVFIKPNNYPQPLLVDQKRHAMNFLGEGCVWAYCLGIDTKTRELVNPFTSQEEKEFFDKIMGRDLNHRKKDDNYWHETQVKITRSNELMAGRKFLDLSDPTENLHYRILKSNNTEFADGQEDFNLNSYRKFILVMEDEEVKQTSKNFNDEIDVWMEIVKMKNSKSEMIRFLTLFNSYKKTGKIIPEDNSAEWYETEVMACVKDSMDICIKITQNKDKDIAELIADGLSCNAVTRKGVNSFTLPGLPDTYIMEDFIKYLKTIKGDPIYLTLEAQVFAYRESKGKKTKSKKE